MEPREPFNIGSVCRAAKSMGVRELAIVSQSTPNLRAARITATHAGDLLDRVEISPTLAAAITDCRLVAAITRRRGRWRKQRSVTPAGLAAMAAVEAGGRIAVVFGNEASGLDDADVALCHIAVHIPTDPSCPSLNLSHAVQLILWSLFVDVDRRSAPRDTRAASPQHTAKLVVDVRARLGLLGMFEDGRHPTLRQLLRDTVARAGLSRAEVDRLRGLLQTTTGLTERWYRRRDLDGGNHAN